MADNNVIITGALELVAQSDGSQFAPNLNVQGVASQSYTEDGKYFPDWTRGSRPVFTPVVYDTVVSSVTPKPWKAGANPNALDEDNHYIQAWYYNGSRIVWVEKSGETGIWESTVLGADGVNSLFQLDWSHPESPVMTIVNNIPYALSAADNDYVEFTGSILSGQASFPITVGREIKINELSGGTPYKIEISLANGNSFDGSSETDDALYVDVVALLGTDGSVQADANHVPGVEAANAHSGIYNVRAITSGQAQLYAIDLSQSVGIDRYYYTESGVAVMIANNPRPTGGFFIKANDVGGECIIVMRLIDLTSQSEMVLATASEKISDLGDPDVITWVPTCTKEGSSRVTAKEVKSGETVSVQAAVMTRNGGVDVSTLYTFSEFKVRQSGKTADITANVVTTAWSVDGNGHGNFGTNFEKILQYGAILATVKARRN